MSDSRPDRSRRAQQRARTSILALAMLAMASPALGQAPDGGRVRILFLGDNGHHQPERRAKEILPVLAQRGIDMFYTDELGDLNPTELNQYHALLLYNNHVSVSPDQMNALMGFVQRGGGLVVVHCASASFQNSEEFIRLVGAAFKSHGTGTFSTVTVAANHPVMQGVPAFETWDETYVHTKHNPDRTVLAVRREGTHEEPWTWVRNYGEGRVFYTAWGHDQRTWGNEGFQTLLERGVKWSSGDWALRQAQDEPNPEMVALPEPLPVYRRDTTWNVLADQHVTREAVALSPEASLRLMTLRPGFRVQQFAAEPLINNIIDFAWDARGRMWAVETEDYPNTVLPEGEPGHDRIVILEDTNGDGVADSRKVFADSMNLATSLVFANGGLIVGQAPHMLFFKDTNGDDRADTKEILFTGFPRNDTHGTISNLRWGFDNQIWGSVGYNGFRGTVGDITYERVPQDSPLVEGRGGPFGAGYFRFPRDLSTLDYVARTSNNTWGFAFTEDGYAFGSTANSRPTGFIHIPGRYYRSLGMALDRFTLPGIHDRNDVYPVREIYQVDQFGRYTAAAAHEVYTARAFPKEYWNRIAFVVEPTAHLVGMFELMQEGSGFTAKNKWNLMASRDAWSAPVQVKVGPDGAVWVSDFYSLVAQHNPTPEEMTPTCCRTGRGAAYETPNRDKLHARIYRISWEGAPPGQPLRLDNATPQQLVAALRNDNMHWRHTAQRLLVERGQTDVVPALIELARDQTVDAQGLNVGALHALWTLDGLGAIASNTAARDAARQALHHPASSLRRAALQMLPRDAQLLDDIFAAGLLPDRTSPHQVEYTVGNAILQDADPQVRLTALLAVSELPPSPRAAQAILELIYTPQNARDRWLPDAAAIAGFKQGPDFMVQFLGRRAPNDTLALAGLRNTASLITRSHATQANTDAVVAIMIAAAQANPAIATSVLTTIAPPPPPEGRGGRGGRGRGGAAWPQEQPPTLTPEQRSALVAAVQSAPAELREAYTRIAAHWGMPDLFGGRP